MSQAIVIGIDSQLEMGAPPPPSADEISIPVKDAEAVC